MKFSTLLNYWNSLPNWAKTIGIAFILTCSTILTLNFNKNILNEDKSDKKDLPNTPQEINTDYKIVSLTVKTIQKVPLDNVSVEFNYQGAPNVKSTDSNGYVQTKILKRDDITVYLRKEGYRTKTITLNLKSDPDTNREIQLESESPPPQTNQSSNTSNSPNNLSKLTNEPSSPAINSNTQKTFVDPGSDLIKEFEGLTFNFKNCRLESQKILCSFLITNKTRDRKLTFSPFARIIFITGDELTGYDVLLGNKNGFYHQVITTIPQETSLKSSVIFKDVRLLPSKTINFLEISFGTENQEGTFVEEKLQFHNINISN